MDNNNNNNKTASPAVVVHMKRRLYVRILIAQHNAELSPIIGE